ncbi:alpha/beta hydrolase fold domain-containing protein [Mycobacterium sp. 852014-50255_SCH5639931]|uniref:alpha/beta hydrolase fold domain-containing protein n=1 Tax=Mycobacterium sp. 852014-50255_SCH5639931 TaxID=1834112 RepID=UPI000800CBD6|nr:alpha/beta hydrolase [Mycobacterium sp. 852014-50255_SCH5639931]OBB68020.1 esterase [Mycobacterium sp. 852014-50255_SCH5639931]
MSAPAAVPGSPRPSLRAAQARKSRRYPVRADAVVDVIPDGPSMAARIAALSTRLMIRPALSVGSYLPSAPWPWGVVDFSARAITPARGTVRAGIGLTHCTAQLIRAAGVSPADGTRRVVLYLHGGAFLACGAYSHGRLVSMLSGFADTPVLVPSYRKLPKYSIGDAIDDCYEGYSWLRRKGYKPNQIVLAGDSAGGYLALTLAQRLLECGEQPAALVAMSPLLQLASQQKTTHPNIGADAMFPPRAFDAFHGLITRAAARRGANGYSDALYEPLDHIQPGLPPVLIHVSGCEVLLHDAHLAAQRLSTVGVPVDVKVWPGQIHVFQLAAPMIPEATRSLRQIGRYIRDATG